jgi:hypothetical protein
MTNKIKHICQGIVLLFFILLLSSFNPEGKIHQADVIIYGGTSSAVIAAVEVAQSGKSVIMVSPDIHLGGLTSGGLGWTDTGKKETIGGLAREFYHRIYNHYQQEEAWKWMKKEEYGNTGQGTPAIDGDRRTMWIFEPHVAEQVFEEFIAEHKIRIFRNEWLDRQNGVKKTDGKISSIITLSGKTFTGKMFIDATYEGDLMAAAKVSYHVGREGSQVYGEEWNGVQTGVFHHEHHFKMIDQPIDPYREPGNPSSGLLPRISPEPPGEKGQGDRKVQAYCFRVCMTNHPGNRIPFPKPEGYDSSQYELLVRIFNAGWRDWFGKFDDIPNRKTDTNNHGPFSSDNIGMNYDYPEASYERRKEIIKEHENYQKGLLWFVANDPRVPSEIQTKMKQWGLPKDEFADNGHWPHQLYIRESRRMIGKFVMTENELLKRVQTPESVGMGSYTMDSHHVQRYVTKEGYVHNEGDVGVGLPGPYEIAYGALVPKKEECRNLLVPVCVSSSHIAYGSIRMEPVFMILGQSAAVAACLAIDENKAVQDIGYEKLKKILLQKGQVLTRDNDLLSIVRQKKNTLATAKEAEVKLGFFPLYPGAVKPGGWIRDWATSALSGITGHLDEWDPAFGEAWKGKGFQARGANAEDGTGWPLEQCGYWLDGAVRLAYIMNDTALINKVSKRLDLVVEGVLHGGESLIFWKPKTLVEQDGFNNWAHSHMGRALVAYYQATGKQSVLDALIKVYSNYHVPVFRNSFAQVSGMVNIDPMLDTYLMSGNRKILDQVMKIATDTSFNGVTGQWASGKINNGHGVITYENIRVPAQLYPWTGNRQFLEASLSCFGWLDEHHMLPCGVASSEEHNAGIGSTRNIETCNVAASAWSCQKLFEITGNSSWGDRIEQVFFNAGPAPVSRDFQTMCYYQSPNRIGNIIPSEVPKHPSDTGSSPYVFRPVGHDVLCCVGNLNRVIPNYIMHMWMGTFDNGLAACLYGPSQVRATVGEGIPVKIISETDYPFTEQITLVIEPERSVNFPLYLRIPAWCKNASFTLNGEKVKAGIKENGFTVIDRKWETGDRLKISFPMQVQVISGHETTYPQSGYFLEGGNRKLAQLKDINNPFQSILYGPLLFALPIRDLDTNTQAPDQQWNFALHLDEAKPDEGIEIIRGDMPATWRWEADSPVKLKVPATEFDWSPTELQPLPENRVRGGKDTRITLIPYGCTKFRISMFPVAR